MAATRGDPRRRVGSVFTVQSAGPGPCRDGLGGGARLPLRDDYKYGRTTFTSTGIRREFPRIESATELSRDGSRDALAEVSVETPLSEKARSATDPQLSESAQVSFYNNTYSVHCTLPLQIY